MLVHIFSEKKRKEAECLLESFFEKKKGLIL